MGTPISVIGNMHTCPMSEGFKKHTGGPISGPGIPGVFIQGQPAAAVGDMCVCIGPPDSIVSGCPGVLIDGKQAAWQGSRTTHGGVITEGVPGVTISGGLATRSDNPEKLEPRIFNLQWKKKEKITRIGKYDKKAVLSADTVGYEDGDEVTIKIYQEGNEEPADEVKGTVRDHHVEVEWVVKSENEE